MHRRHELGPEGNVQNFKVRMSNLLVHNFAVWLELLRRYRKVWFVIEQPTSSYLFKMNCMLALAAVACCTKVTTWTLRLIKWYGDGFIFSDLLLYLYWTSSSFVFGVYSEDGFLSARHAEANAFGR